MKETDILGEGSNEPNQPGSDENSMSLAEFPGDITPSMLESPNLDDFLQESPKTTDNQNTSIDHSKSSDVIDLNSTRSPLDENETSANNDVDSSDKVTKSKPDESNDDAVPTETNEEEEDDFDIMKELDSSESERRGGKPKDIACWQCHQELVDFSCSLCPRGFHLVCMESGTAGGGPDWICPICEKVSDAECVDSPTNLPEYISQETLCLMLKFAITNCRPKVNDLFHFPVSLEHFPTYPNFVINPMDLATLEQNCKDMKYYSTTAFVADVEWIYHNSCVFNSPLNPISKVAKRAVVHLKNEVEIIEVCANCYANHLLSNGFSQLCRDAPHEPVWAKVSGYPYWPAKVIREKAMQVEVLFFGDHDRAWLPKNKVLRMSKSLPEAVKHNQKAFEVSMEELKDYCDNLQLVTNFKFSPHRTSFTGENKISRVQPSRTRRLSNFEYNFDDSKMYIKSEPESSADSANEDLESDAEGLPAQVIIKEEPLDNSGTFQNLSLDIPRTSSSSTSARSPSLQRTRNSIYSRSGKDIDFEVDNFDMRFHLLTTTVNNSSDLNTFNHSLEKDWTSDDENSSSSADQTYDLDKIVSVVQDRYSKKEVSNTNVTGNSSSSFLAPSTSSYPASPTGMPHASKSVNSWLAARKNSLPTMVQCNILAMQPPSSFSKQISPLVQGNNNSNADKFSFTDSPTHRMPSTSRLNMQIRQSLEPISPNMPAAHFVPISSNQQTWTSNVPQLGFDQNGGNMMNVFGAPNANTCPGITTNHQIAVSSGGFVIPVSSLQQQDTTSSQLRKRLNEEGGLRHSPDLGPQPPTRPRLEVKGTPNVEAQLQGSLAEAKIVDKVTEKLNDSLQTMVESFLSNRINNNVESPTTKVSSDKDSAECSGELKRKIASLEAELQLTKQQKKVDVMELCGFYEYLLAEAKYGAEVAFKHEFEKFKDKTVKEIKSRQWCSVCKKEAFYNCCWNTSYCSCECQKLHWATHSATCSHLPQSQPNPSPIPILNQPQINPTPSSASSAITPGWTHVTSVVIPSVTRPHPNLHSASKPNSSEGLSGPSVRFLNQQHSSSVLSSTNMIGSMQSNPTHSNVIVSNPSFNPNSTIGRVRPKLLNSTAVSQFKTPKIQKVMSLASNQAEF